MKHRIFSLLSLLSSFCTKVSCKISLDFFFMLHDCHIQPFFKGIEVSKKIFHVILQEQLQFIDALLFSLPLLE